MSSRKVKDFKLQRRTSAPDKLAAATRDDEVMRSIRMLAELQKKQHNEIQVILEQMGELNLRIRFVMEMFKYEKGARIVGVDGQPMQQEIRSLHELYLANRVKFLDMIMPSEREDDGQAAHPDGDTKTSEPTDQPTTPTLRGSAAPIRDDTRRRIIYEDGNRPA